MSDPGDHPAPDPRSDDDPLRLRASVGPREEFVFETADGLVSPTAFREPELRLLDVLAEDPPARLLVPDANYGVVGIVLAAFADAVRMTESSARAAGRCRANAARNGMADRTAVAITADPRTVPGSFDAAALAPAGYVPVEVVNQRLADAIATLDPGGACYLAASPETGLRRYERTLRELCDGVTTVHTQGDVSVLCGRRPTDYIPPRYAEPRTITAEIAGTTLMLTTYPGLFSPAGVDAGTRALAEHVAPRDGDRVLDLACGYGPLGVHAAKTADCRVVLTDDDCVATACARDSAARSGVADRVEIQTGDGVDAVRDRTFDRIVCNPPTHAGAGVQHDLMRGARAVLAPDGVLQLVHHEGVAYDRYLDPYFDAVARTAHGEYRIVSAGP